jgi:hypothetical protein
VEAVVWSLSEVEALLLDRSMCSGDREYTFLPGEELQHDTSPHEVQLGGKLRKAQTASASASRLMNWAIPTVRHVSSGRSGSSKQTSWRGAASPTGRV